MRLLKRFFARPMNGVVAALAVLGATGTGVMLNAAPAFALTPSCTFSPTSAADGTSVSNAAGQVIKGVNAGSSITLSCTGFSSLDTLFIVEASPLAGIVQPLSLTNQSAEGQLTAVGADASGNFSGTFIVKKTGDATNPFTAVDPAAACPPTAAQINAGLTNCVITVADIAGNRPPGQPFLSFAGQASSGNPTLTVNTPAITVNDTVTVGESGGHSTFWWSGAFIGGAPSTGSTVYTGANTTAGAIATATTISVASTATFASSGTIDVTNAAAGTDTYTYTGTTATSFTGLAQTGGLGTDAIDTGAAVTGTGALPAPTVLVGGVPAAVSTVTVGPTVYTQTTCTGTPATSCTSAGTLTQGALTGTFKVPAGVTAGATAVTVIEGNGNPVYAIDPTLNPGNWGGPLPPATSAIDASAVTTYLDTTTASANPSPNSGGTGTTVTVSGSGFDPQQVSCGLSFTVGSDTGTCNVDSSGNLTGSITVGPSETTGITGPTADNIKVAEVGQPNVNLSIPFTLLPLSNTCPISTFAEPNPSPNDTGTTAKALNNNGPAAAQASEVGEPNCTINQIISVNVAGTVLTLSEAQSFTNPAGNPAGTAVSLSNITLGPQDFQNATGNLNTVNVNDARGTLDGWVVTGQMETDFNNATPSGNAVDNVIPADNLTWGPSIALTHGGTIPASNTNTCLDGPSSHTGSCPGPSGAVTGNGAGITGSNGSALNTSTPSEAFAGASANLNNETANGVPMVLCYAPEGGGGGGFLCNATLSLAVPPYVAAGTYSAVMDIVVTGL